MIPLYVGLVYCGLFSLHVLSVSIKKDINNYKRKKRFKKQCEEIEELARNFYNDDEITLDLNT